MQYPLTLDRFEGEQAILKTEDGKTITWPTELLPENTKEGAILFFSINPNPEAEAGKRDLAKQMLNELLSPEQK